MSIKNTENKNKNKNRTKSRTKITTDIPTSPSNLSKYAGSGINSEIYKITEQVISPTAYNQSEFSISTFNKADVNLTKIVTTNNKDETITYKNYKAKFNFFLPPAMETQASGKQIPEIKPGILIRHSSNIKSYSIPGSFSAPQFIGFGSTLLQVVGLLIGPGDELSIKHSNVTNKTIPNNDSSFGKTNAYKMAQHFINYIYNKGIPITFYYKGSNDYVSSNESKFYSNELYNVSDKNKPETIVLNLTCLIQSVRFFISRYDRVYYSFEFLVLDDLMIESKTIKFPTNLTYSISGLTSNQQASIQQLEQQHRTEIAELTKQHSKKIEELTKSYESKLKAAQTDAEKEAITKEYEEALRKLKQQQEDELNTLTQRQRNNLADAIQDFLDKNKGNSPSNTTTRNETNNKQSSGTTTEDKNTGDKNTANEYTVAGLTTTASITYLGRQKIKRDNARKKINQIITTLDSDLKNSKMTQTEIIDNLNKLNAELDVLRGDKLTGEVENLENKVNDLLKNNDLTKNITIGNGLINIPVSQSSGQSNGQLDSAFDTPDTNESGLPMTNSKTAQELSDDITKELDILKSSNPNFSSDNITEALADKIRSLDKQLVELIKTGSEEDKALAQKLLTEFKQNYGTNVNYRFSKELDGLNTTNINLDSGVDLNGEQSKLPDINQDLYTQLRNNKPVLKETDIEVKIERVGTVVSDDTTTINDFKTALVNSIQKNEPVVFDAFKNQITMFNNKENVFVPNVIIKNIETGAEFRFSENDIIRIGNDNYRIEDVGFSKIQAVRIKL